MQSNLGLTTDLLLHAQTSVVDELDDYIVIRTPEAPVYFFGNQLVLPRRPHVSDLSRIEQDFARQVGVPPRIAHRMFTWVESDEDAIDLNAFVEHGYDLTICRVLTAQLRQILPVATNAEIQVRKFRTQEDWNTWSAMQLANMRNPLDITSQRYIVYQQTAYQRLIEQGLGDWWGAFIDEEQVGSLGLFFLEGLGRFQSVLTAEHHRNKGVCKTLVSEVIKLAGSQADQLVMVADETYHAGKIYEALGFKPDGRLGSLCHEP